MNFPFLGNDSGRYLLVLKSGVRVRFTAEVIHDVLPEKGLLLMRDGKQIGSVDPSEVAALLDIAAIEEFPPPVRY